MDWQQTSYFVRGRASKPYVEGQYLQGSYVRSDFPNDIKINIVDKSVKKLKIIEHTKPRKPVKHMKSVKPVKKVNQMSVEMDEEEFILL